MKCIFHAPAANKEIASKINYEFKLLHKNMRTIARCKCFINFSKWMELKCSRTSLKIIMRYVSVCGERSGKFMSFCGGVENIESEIYRCTATCITSIHYNALEWTENSHSSLWLSVDVINCFNICSVLPICSQTGIVCLRFTRALSIFISLLSIMFGQMI